MREFHPQENLVPKVKRRRHDHFTRRICSLPKERKNDPPGSLFERRARVVLGAEKLTVGSVG